MSGHAFYVTQYRFGIVPSASFDANGAECPHIALELYGHPGEFDCTTTRFETDHLVQALVFWPAGTGSDIVQDLLELLTQRTELA